MTSRTRTRALVIAAAIVVMMVIVAGSLESSSSSAAAPPATKPNVVIVIADDMRWDDTDGMPWTTANIRDRGRSFTQAYVPTSVCCPSRVSLLTGNFSHTTHVWSNDEDSPYGGFTAFSAGRDDQTLATWLSASGYRTGLFGKYLNGYHGPYVPPGWSAWNAFGEKIEYTYFDWWSASGAHLVNTLAYSTSFFAKKAADFIRTTPTSQPLFVVFAPKAPHLPSTPQRNYVGSEAGVPALRPPNYDEAEVGDKPPYVRKVASWGSDQRDAVDLLHERRLESLRSVDDAVRALTGELSSAGRLQNTIFVVVSDNGFCMGEHRLDGKYAPYECSTRVPLWVRWDASGWSGTTSAALVAANVDLTATIVQATGVGAPPIDGVPLATGRTELVAEHFKDSEDTPSYCGVRRPGELYVRYGGGFEEYYDYGSDPFELKNVAKSRPSDVAALRGRARALCGSGPPGYAW
jgi:N-acetylglucosamine-6-sulfatase